MLRFADHLAAVPGLARRVLVVEDDATARNALVRILVMHGYEVLPAADLAKAQTQLVWQPDFVLLDLMLPDGSGVELLSRIRRRDASTLVAVLSAAAEGELAKAAAYKPDAVFRKPLELPALLEWLKNPIPMIAKPPVVAFRPKEI
jgi:DNA-binding response OmpR family regulator